MSRAPGSSLVTGLRWREPGGLSGCTIAVLGMARTGKACAAVLRGRGAQVIAYDAGNVTPDTELRDLLDRGVPLRCGPEYQGIEEADLVVPSPGIRRDAPVLVQALDRGTPILSEVEVAYRISMAPLLAFTGTNGKSTTTALCGEMLRESGLRPRVGGNLAPGVPLVTLADRATERDILVAEVSSFQLEWIEAFRPRVAAILNLTPEHLDRHGSVREYAEAKARISENQRAQDLAIFGDAFAEEYPDLLGGLGRHYRFSRSHPVESGAYLDRKRIRIVGRVDAAEGSLPDLSLDLSRMALSGGHNQENAMAAALASLEMGARPEAIERALRNFRGLPHRMERVGEVDGVLYVNNSMCTNPAASIASLEAADGGIIVITGGRSKGLDMRPFGEALARRALWTVLIGEAADEMQQYLEEAGSRAFERAESLDQAVELAARKAVCGNTVILSPGYSSFDMFSDFESRGRAFAEAVQRRMGRRGRDHEST